ncbi:MAG: MerR family transcriptional regulator [Gammaproteobacteria bacterium]|nr:MerR family transcriptional regulator [Gammaproteobacteria bacterium]
MSTALSASAAKGRTLNKRRDRRDEYRIGDIARLTGLSADTLRYYEQIKLLPAVNRTASGIRVYTGKDISRLNFIQRAQKMNFSLAEIGELLKMREDPRRARDEVRRLTAAKLSEVEARLNDLNILRKELRLLLNLCKASDDGCPIIEGIDRKVGEKTRQRRRVKAQR